MTIRARGLGFWYGRVLALADVDLEIGPGITGLVGANGSGKTTLLRLANGFLRPRAGTIEVFGSRPWNSPSLQRRMGFLPEADPEDPTLTAAGFVRFVLGLKGFGGREAARRAAHALEELGVAGNANRPLAALSRGDRQRVRLAAAVAHDPELLILDEPFAGMDPVARRSAGALLAGRASRGCTIVISDHILAQVEALTREVALLHRGRLLAKGDLAVIREVIDRQPHTIRVRGPDVRAVATRLAAEPAVEAVHFDEDGSARFRTRRPLEFCATLTKLAASDGMPVEEIEWLERDLASVFRHLTRP